MMNNQHIADLTIKEFQDLVRDTVQQAVSEVLIEFAAAAEVDAQVSYEAEIADLLRTSLQRRSFDMPPEPVGSWELDD